MSESSTFDAGTKKSTDKDSVKISTVKNTSQSAHSALAGVKPTQTLHKHGTTLHKMPLIMPENVVLPKNKPESDPVSQNQMADNITSHLIKKLNFDDIAMCWYACNDLYMWESVTALKAEYIIEGVLQQFKEGYAAGYLGGIVRLLKNRLIAPPWSNDKEYLPLQNGVFNMAAKKLEPYSDKTRFIWRLPFQYKEDAQCPLIDNWLETVTGADKGLIRFLKCWLMAVLTRRHDLQKYLELIGHGGTGKAHSPACLLH